VDIVTPRNGLRSTPRFKEWATGVWGLFGALAAAAAVIAFGVWLYVRPAMCEGKQMSPGDICVTESGGGEEITRRDYNEVLESQQLFAVAVLAVGALIILVAFGFAGGALRERLISWRSRRGVSTITPRPMTVILLGVLALIAGGVGVGLNVGAVVDLARCGDEPSAASESCDATSNSDEEAKQALIAIGGFVVAAGGLIAGIVGRSARRAGTWKQG
jgi:hypothetical protein